MQHIGQRELPQTGVAEQNAQPSLRLSQRRATGSHRPRFVFRHQRQPRNARQQRDRSAQREHSAPAETRHQRRHHQRRGSRTEAGGGDDDRHAAHTFSHWHVDRHRHRCHRKYTSLRNAEQDPRADEYRRRAAARQRGGDERGEAAADQRERECRPCADPFTKDTGRNLEERVRELERPGGDGPHRHDRETDGRDHAFLCDRDICPHQIRNERDQTDEQDHTPVTLDHVAAPCGRGNCGTVSGVWTSTVEDTLQPHGRIG